MISAEDVPHFTGDLEQLEQHTSGLRSHAGALRQAGSAAHSKFQGLEAFYRAPEAEELFASTAPVRDRADQFASKVETVAQALDEYAGAVRPVIARLDRLRGRVADFVSGLRTDSGEIDAEWTRDQDKVDQHTALWGEIAEAQAAFTRAEITANNKITALVDGTQYVAQGYEGTLGPLGARVYGYTAEALKHADKLPWGTPEARTYGMLDLSHHIEEAGVSIKDNLVGAVTGFADLVSPGADGDAARKGLYMSALGLESYLFDPLNKQDSPWKEQAAEGRQYAKAFAKSMVGWDDWEEHPGKATGTVIFNGLTFASGPLAAVARMAKGGAVAKTAGTLAKVGEALDPLSATAKTVGATTRAIPRIAEVTARARAGFADIPGAGSTNSVWRVSATTELHVTDGKFVIVKDGVPDTTPAPVERRAHERVPSVVTSREHQLAGVGARAPEASTDVGGDAAVGAVGHAENGPVVGEGHSSPGDAGTPPQGSGSHTPPHDNSVGHEPTSRGDSSSSHTGHHAGGGTGSAGASHSGGEAAGAGQVSDGPGDHAGDTGHSPVGETDATDGVGDEAGNAPESSPGPSGPMEWGGEAERRLREGLRGIPRNNMKPKVMEKAISRLAEHEYGREVAEIISSGHLSHAEGFRDVVSSLGSGVSGQYIRGIDQIRLGDQFHKAGLRNVEFEIKNPSIKADIDIRVTDDTGKTYGYQMKRLNNPKHPFESIAKAENLGQLSKSESDVKIMLVDGQGTIADWKARGITEELLQVHRGEHPLKSEKGRGILFVLRLEDGTIVIPPGSKVDPRGVL
ncbi:hypothetical protein GKQ77_17680 [Streptomyces sp. BG9H]|uniref:Uncharacterized protein n=1 Tax=Streptomyces anatolicus TaxID=2675858 RepID=A0ABS6YQL6_9ACTN|nr:hypothetical protein [Streptomyces anatolicus]MBW5423375.1 hypothetical protein [Streptomyces anatolicus]